MAYSPKQDGEEKEKILTLDLKKDRRYAIWKMAKPINTTMEKIFKFLTRSFVCSIQKQVSQI